MACRPLTPPCCLALVPEIRSASPGERPPRRSSDLYTAVGRSRRRGRTFDIPAVCLPHSATRVSERR